MYIDVPFGLSKSDQYKIVRKAMQKAANDSKRDYAIEWNSLFKEFVTYALPNKENRYGSELFCEVVSPE